MKKIISGSLSLLFAVVSVGFCDGPLASGVVGVVESQGNRWHGIAVPYSTNTAVLLSSAAANNSTISGAGDYRFREFVNCSNGGMMLMGTASEFSTYSSTKSIHITSGTANQGESWKYYGQGEVWAIWNPGTTNGGACGSEHWFKK